MVAQTFRILLAPSDILTTQTLCTIRPARKSRCWLMIVMRLITLIKTIKFPCHKGELSDWNRGLLPYLDENQLTDSPQELIPIIIAGIDLRDDDWARAVYIKTLLTLIPTCQSLVEEHIDSVINRMTDQGDNRRHFRSLRSLQSSGSRSLTCLVKHVRPVLLKNRSLRLISELDVAKNDPSREVRKRAEKFRLAWSKMLNVTS